ncbi:MAG: glutathione S-transferase family protein [Pseudomonadota bacterium]
MMKIYANPGSGSACVEAALAELGLPFERVMVDYTDDGIVDPEFIKINPRRQIPALILDDGRCLTETMAMLMYLADKHPESALAPRPGSFERAKLDQWMSFTLANIYEGELRKNYPHRYVAGETRLVEESAETFVMANYALLEEACSDGPFFFGATLTILDIYLWMFVNWFEELEEMRRDCPRIIAVATSVMERPSIAPIHAFNYGEGLGWNEH